MKATEQYFPVLLFIMLYKEVHSFEFVDEILKKDYSNPGGVLPITDYTGRLRSKGVPFLGWRYVKG